MKTVTYEEFLKFEPCWMNYDDKAKMLAEIGKRKEHWTAMDVLNLPEEEVSAGDKIWAVLRPEFIEDNTLHEFACRCAEEALSHIENPDPRSVAAIEAKRKWVRGEISDKELDAARTAARSAARDDARDAASSAARSAAMFAARSAASSTARYAASSAARSAASSAAMFAARSAASSAAMFAAWYAASSAAWYAASSAASSAARYAASSAAMFAASSAASSAAWYAALTREVKMLKELLEYDLDGRSK